MIGVWDWDVPAARIRSDERFARLCGLDPAAAAEGVAVLDVMRLLHPDDLDRVRSEIREVFATGREYSIEYRVRVEGGPRRWIHARGRCAFRSDGKPHPFAGVAIELPERKPNEAPLVAATAERDIILPPPQPP